MVAAFRCSCVLLLLVVAAASFNAKAGPRDDVPTMEVQVVRTIADFWPDRPGLESEWLVTVINVSQPGEHNNMLQFVYPAGDVVNHLFYVLPGSGWTATRYADRVQFDGLLPPGSLIHHRVYSTLLDTGHDYATAIAAGPPEEPFNPVLVGIPVLLGDLDEDGEVSLADLSPFVDCLTGPDYSGQLSLQCELGDFEPDGDVDLKDFAGFQTAFGADTT